MPDVATVLKECSVSYRSTGIEYQLIRSFENETEVEIESFWSKSVTHNTGDGLKQFFYCSIARNKCRKRSYLHFVNNSDLVHFYENDCNHNHDPVTRGLSIEQKEIIKRLYSQGVTKPSLILRAFEKDETETPVLSKVSNYLKTIKANIYGANRISLGELVSWCRENSHIPSDMDEAFVLNYDINSEDEESGFRFLLPHCVY